MEDFEPMRPPAKAHAWEASGERFSVTLVNAELPYGPSVTWNREDGDAPEEQMLDAFAWEILRLRKEYDDDGACECARIRKALLEAIADLTVYVKWESDANCRPGKSVAIDDPYLSAADLLAAVDRICPEGGG